MASPETIERIASEQVKKINGGFRINSGRPPTKRLFTERFNALLEKKIEQRMGKMIDAQIDAAIGTTSEKYNAKNGEYIYVENAPSTAAFNTLADRTIGKPKDSVVHTGSIGVLHLIKSLNASDGNEGAAEE